MLITISRQFGAGGSAVAERIAAALGWRLVDNELVERVATRAGLSADAVAALEERVPRFVERLAQSLVAATPELFPAGGPLPKLAEPDIVRITETVVAELAAQGDIVFVGRATAALLASERDALHLRVVAPREARVAVIARRFGIAATEAASMLDRTDAMRARYHREYYHRDWEAAVNYHLVLNTTALGLDGAAELVVGWITRR